jgi:hypothetical protein
MDFQLPYREGGLQPGDIVTLNSGHRYKITRKGTTALAATRYYWFDELYDRITRKRPHEIPHSDAEFTSERRRGRDGYYGR